MLGRAAHRLWMAGVLAPAMAFVGGCGGGADPLGNPPAVMNSSGALGTNLSYAYFQSCINPILNEPHSITLNGTTITNVCSSSGCHALTTGRGAAFRVVPTATPVILTESQSTIRAQSMYQNFYSAQAMTIVGDPSQSLLINKPLTRGVLHGGGVIFSSANDPSIVQMEFWISNPMPAGQDEFGLTGSAAAVAGVAAQTNPSACVPN